MNENNSNIKTVHNLIMENREKLTLTGVIEVFAQRSRTPRDLTALSFVKVSNCKSKSGLIVSNQKRLSHSTDGYLIIAVKIIATVKHLICYLKLFYHRESVKTIKNSTHQNGECCMI